MTPIHIISAGGGGLAKPKATREIVIQGKQITQGGRVGKNNNKMAVTGLNATADQTPVKVKASVLIFPTKCIRCIGLNIYGLKGWFGRSPASQCCSGDRGKSPVR